MKIFLSTLFVFCFTFMFTVKVNATHVSGTEFSYTCTSTPGIFEVTCVLYVRCTGGSVPICTMPCGGYCGVSLPIYGATPGFNDTLLGTFNLQLRNVRDVDKKITCPNIKNVCNHSGCVAAGTYTPGIERYEYKGLVNLGPTSGIPAGCCTIKISYSACCRSSYSWGGDMNYSNELVMNRCLTTTPCNNSPVFKNDPRIVIPAGENFTDNWGATDPDHDSLSYSFAPAYTQSGVSVFYVPPYTYNKPFPWTGSATGAFPNGIHCDPLNGDVMFTPPNAGSATGGTMCIEVKEWKKINGIPTLISTIRRDMEMTIMGSSVPNNPPRFITNPPEGGNVNSPKTNMVLCAGEQYCFTITAKDTDVNLPLVSDTTYMRWDSALANLGATFLPDYDIAKRLLPDSLGGGPREDRYKFCWTPADSLISLIPYYFTVNAMDKRCPTPGELTRAFSILVLPKISVQIVKTINPCQNTLLSYQNLTPSIPASIAIWRIAKQQNDSLFANGFDTYIASTTPEPFSFKNAGRYYIQLLVNGVGPNGTPGCLRTYTDYIDAKGLAINDSIISTDPICTQMPSGKIVLRGYHGTPPYQYKLDSSIFTTNDTFTNLMAGKYITTVKDSNGCFKTDSVVLQNPFPLSAHFTVVSTSCFNGNDGWINITPVAGIAPYTYRLNQLPTQTIPLFQNLHAGKYLISLTDSNLCQYADSVTITQPTVLSYVKNKTEISCFNANDGSLSIIPGGGIAPYQLLFDSFLYTLPATLISIKPDTYRYQIIDNRNCQIELMDSFENPQPIIAGTISGDTSVIVNSTHTYSVPFQSNLSFAWAVAGGTLLSSSMNPPLATVRWDSVGIGTIGVVAYSNTLCGDTATLQVNIGSVGLTELTKSWGLNVYPNPAKNILNISLQKLPEATQIELFDMQGKCVMKQELKLTQQLYIETLAPGIYLLKIGTWSGQVVKE